MLYQFFRDGLATGEVYDFDTDPPELDSSKGEWLVYVAPPPQPPPVPTEVTMRQACLKLISEPFGEGTRYDAVATYIATQSPSVQVEWDRAGTMRRDHPMVAIMGYFFGQTSDDIDQWFREADAIGPTVAS